MKPRVRLQGFVAGVAIVGVVISIAAAGATPAIPSGAGDAGALALGRPERGEVVPPALEDVEQMCALLTSCDGLPLPVSMIPTDFGTCVSSLSDALSQASALSFSLTIRECGLRANTCAELRTCALRGARPDACVGRGESGPAGYCDSQGRALTCLDQHVVTVRDCPRGGEQCAVRDGQAMCALGACARGARGDQDAEAPSCSASGTRIVRCEKSKLVSLDCAAFGLKCAGLSTGPACVPPTKTCSGDEKRCDDRVRVECFHGHEVRIDCAAAGLRCGGPGSAVGSCTGSSPDDAACTSGAAAHCEGTTIRYCAAGHTRRFPCKALAFNRCVEDAKGARCGS